MRIAAKDGISQDHAEAAAGIASNRQTANERKVARTIVVSHPGEYRQGDSKADTPSRIASTPLSDEKPRFQLRVSNMASGRNVCRAGLHIHE
jgi:hypothetical protein